MGNQLNRARTLARAEAVRNIATEIGQRVRINAGIALYGNKEGTVRAFRGIKRDQVYIRFDEPEAIEHTYGGKTVPVTIKRAIGANNIYVTKLKKDLPVS